MRLVIAVLGLVCLSSALVAVPPQPAPEFAAVQTPAKPPPFPVNLVDQGQFDPQFRGYFLPEGFRIEVVATDPDVINPVGITFGPDGNLFVLEWRKDPVTTSWNEVKEKFHYRDGTTRLVEHGRVDTYTVRLTVEGRTLTQPLVIKRDPRASF